MESPPKPKRCLLMMQDAIKRHGSLNRIDISFPTTLGISTGRCSSASKPDKSMPNLAAFATEVAEKRTEQKSYLDSQFRILQNGQSLLKSMQLNLSESQIKLKEITKETEILTDMCAANKHILSKTCQDILDLSQKGSKLKYDLIANTCPIQNEEKFRDMMQTHAKEISQREESEEYAVNLAAVREHIPKLENSAKNIYLEIEQLKSGTRCCGEQKEIVKLEAEKERLVMIQLRKKELFKREEEQLENAIAELEAVKSNNATQKTRLHARLADRKRHLQQQLEEKCALDAEIQHIQQKM